MELTREQSLDLLKKYNKEPIHIQHALTVEGVMRCTPRKTARMRTSGACADCSTMWTLSSGPRSTA